MAVGSSLVENSAFFLLSTLLIFLHLRPVSVQTVEPAITITKSILKLKSLNDTFESEVFIRCSTGSSESLKQIASVSKLSISHKGEEVNGDRVLLVEATDTQKTAVLKGDAAKNDKYKVSGTIGASRTATQITLTISSATCEDAGQYRCTMAYTRKGASTIEENHADEYVVVAPFDFTVWRIPKDKPITLGVKLTLICTAVVGTLKNDGLTKKSHLEWVYRTRQSALAKQYVALDEDLKKGMNLENTEEVRCSEKQQVTLKLTVKQRDSLRDYFCVAAQYKQGKTEYVGGGANTSIPMPSFEKAEEKALGIGGFVGIALGALALMSGVAFGVIWCKRRQKKKAARTTEIESRKAMIDERRKSITSIVESRKNLIQQEPSSAVESSVAEPEEESTVAGTEETSTVA